MWFGVRTSRVSVQFDVIDVLLDQNNSNFMSFAPFLMIYRCILLHYFS
jgi:hypothetical protein